jgi:ribosomal protein S18 acetylase RimI-like enzyme
MSSAHVVDLSTLRPDELEGLWQREAQSWQERLLWDISDPLYRLQRMVERGSITGKILRDGTGATGYSCYIVAGNLGIICRLVISPECDAGGAEMLVRETVSAIRRAGASRIESPFISIDGRRLPQLFEQQGFHTYQREFLRRQLHAPGDRDRNEQAVNSSAKVHLEPWRGTNLRGAASVMRAAYEGGVDAEINQQYRSDDGCELVLDDILNQGGCGNSVVEASAVARVRGSTIGFIVVTETAHRQAHLAQIAVLPQYQHQGLGRMLLKHGLSKLSDRAFDTISLIVSRQNRRALNTYELIGFEPVLSFPVFTWQG